MQRHNLVSPLRTQKNWRTKKKKLGKSEGKNHSISGSGPSGALSGCSYGSALAGFGFGSRISTFSGSRWVRWV